MSADEIVKSSQTFYFGTKGLTKDDILQIDSIFKKYDIDIIYSADDYKSKDVEAIVEICERTSATSLHANNPMDQKNSYISLLVNGPLSSWEVSYPKEGTVKDRAAVAQLFSEVQKVLVPRKEMFPRLPWSVLRDVAVFIPIFLLSIKVIFPNLYYDYSDILRIAIFTAVFNYLIAFIQIRRIFRRVIIVRPPFRDKLKTIRNWILVTIAASIISSASEKVLGIIGKYFAQ